MFISEEYLDEMSDKNKKRLKIAAGIGAGAVTLGAGAYALKKGKLKIPKFKKSPNSEIQKSAKKMNASVQQDQLAKDFVAKTAQQDAQFAKQMQKNKEAHAKMKSSIDKL